MIRSCSSEESSGVSPDRFLSAKVERAPASRGDLTVASAGVSDMRRDYDTLM